MTAEDWVNLAGDILIWITMLAFVAFVVVLSTLTAWWRSAVGRNIMELCGVIALILVLIVIRLVVGTDALWFQILRTTVFAALPVAIIRRTLLLIRYHRRGPGGERDAAG